MISIRSAEQPEFRVHDKVARAEGLYHKAYPKYFSARERTSTGPRQENPPAWSGVIQFDGCTIRSHVHSIFIELIDRILFDLPQDCRSRRVLKLTRLWGAGRVRSLLLGKEGRRYAAEDHGHAHYDPGVSSAAA
jgi:hypothetical protein